MGGQGLKGQRPEENYQTAAERLLFDAGAETIKANDGASMNVWYFDDEDRFIHQVLIENGKLMVRDEDGVPQILTTVGSPKGYDITGYIYAADIDGNIYAATDKHSGNLQLRHSSFLGGKPVLSAGLIWVSNGDLIFIDNSSGHYKPPESNLYRLISIMSSSGVDMSRARVEPFGSGQKLPVNIYLKTGKLGTRSSTWTDGVFVGGRLDGYNYKIGMINGDFVLGHARSANSYDFSAYSPTSVGQYKLRHYLNSTKTMFSDVNVRVVDASGHFIVSK